MVDESADLGFWQAQLWYALAWFSFGLVHSILARGSGARLLRSLCGAAERLSYNAIATVHFVAVLVVGEFVLSDFGVFDQPGWLVWLRWIVFALGLLIAVPALRSYDLSLFSGMKQYRAGRASSNVSTPQERLVTDGLHRYVRHPLYSALFLCLWGLADDTLSLATAVWGSLYLLIGTFFEERKLIALYGQAYEIYKSRVPPFVPWRGRAI